MKPNHNSHWPTVAVHELLHTEVFSPRFPPSHPTCHQRKCFLYSIYFIIYDLHEIAKNITLPLSVFTKSLSLHNWGLHVWRPGTSQLLLIGWWMAHKTIQGIGEEGSLMGVFNSQALCCFSYFETPCQTLAMWHLWFWPFTIGSSSLVWSGLLSFLASEDLCLALLAIGFNYPESSVLKKGKMLQPLCYCVKKNNNFGRWLDELLSHSNGPIRVFNCHSRQEIQLKASCRCEG